MKRILTALLLTVVTALSACGQTINLRTATIADSLWLDGVWIKRSDIDRWNQAQGGGIDSIFVRNDSLYYAAGDSLVFVKLALPTASTSVLGGVKVDGTSITITDGVISAPGTGAGSVTSVGLSLPSSVFNVAGSPVTTTGSLTGTLKSQGANTFLGGPDGSSGTPSFRALQSSDIPSLDAGKITGLSTVATTGFYNDLLNKPAIPDISGKLDIADTVVFARKSDMYTKGQTDSVAEALAGSGGTDTTSLSNRIDVNEENITLKLNKTDTAGFARRSELFSGDYNSLENKPVIPEINDNASTDTTTYSSSKVNSLISGAGGGDMLKSTYDPTGVNGDAFDYNNLHNKPVIPDTSNTYAVKYPIQLDSVNRTMSVDTTSDSSLVTKNYLSSHTPAPYSLPTASTSVLGGVKVDGTSITISSGVISAPGTGAGSVTSVGLSLPSSLYTITNSPITTTGTLTATLNGQLNNRVFAGPSGGGSGTPSFRTLVAADLPSIDVSKITGLSTVASSGSYNDLTDKPVIPDTSNTYAVQYPVQLDSVNKTMSVDTTSDSSLATKPWVRNEVPTNNTELTNGAGYLTTVPAQSWSSITGKPTFATVATTGSYTDLTDKPAPYSLPTASTSVLGGVKVDGTSITITGGVISAPGTGAGSVTSVGLSLPSSVFTTSGSPVTTTGTLTGTLKSQTANYVFAAPDGVAGAPVFRALTEGDLPTIDVSKITGLSTVATSGAYADLTGKPTIPTNNTQLTNGAGYLTTVPAQSWSSITGKPTFATVATTGSYIDLLNKPTLFSGVYADLTGKPTIPTDNTQLTNGAGYLTSVPAQSWSSITGKPTFATVATTGSYTDLLNKPTIPTNNTQLTNGSGYLTTVPAQSWSSITGKPTFATVATTGSYTDLLNKPTIPTSNGNIELIDAINGLVNPAGTTDDNFQLNTSSGSPYSVIIPAGSFSSNNDVLMIRIKYLSYWASSAVGKDIQLSIQDQHSHTASLLDGYTTGATQTTLVELSIGNKGNGQLYGNVLKEGGGTVIGGDLAGTALVLTDQLTLTFYARDENEDLVAADCHLYTVTIEVADIPAVQ